ncbi:MAG: FliM/FliN family flagellar motor switch protein [Burkholderiales bacterium]
MSARPFLLLGESDHRALAERVDAALAAWRREWLADAAPEPVLYLEAAPRAERWLAAQSDAAVHLLVGCAGSWLGKLGAQLVGGPQPEEARSTPPGASLARSLGETIVEALARRLLGSAPAAAAAELRWNDEGVPQAWLAPGAGAEIYDLAPALPVVIALSPALVAASLPKAPAGRAGRAPLAARSGAVETSVVELQAVAGNAELELGELARLAPGDVIVLERRLDEPLALQLGVHPVARVQLGTAQGARAVQVVTRSHN